LIRLYRQLKGEAYVDSSYSWSSFGLVFFKSI